MPLVRFQVRNEYGLGSPELYNEADREDPKAVLDGVAVAGLVGILRQLGDLAEFAAEVFHGLQEQVMNTSSRSYKLMTRVQHIETALPPLEKMVLAQTSHIHFAYTSGSEWHARIRNQESHFIYNDLPQFIMNSYEECRDPPRLHLLDKFDIGGPGSCLKRYSDPTYFKRASPGNIVRVQKVRRDKKLPRSRSKKKRSSNGAAISKHSGTGGMQFYSPTAQGQTSLPPSVSTLKKTLKCDVPDRLNSFDSRTESSSNESIFHHSSSLQPNEQVMESGFSQLNIGNSNNLDSDFLDDQPEVMHDDFPLTGPQSKSVPNSSSVTWDEKTEIVEPTDLKCVDQMEIMHDGESTPKSIANGDESNEIESEADNYVDALNTISESEHDFDCQTKREVEPYFVPKEEIEVGKIEIIEEPESDHHSADLESHTIIHDLTNNEVVHNLSNVDYAACTDQGESAQIISPSSGPSNSLECQESVELPNNQPVNFWTNGYLLGLEPSKPPDFSVLNSSYQNSMDTRKDETSGSQSLETTIEKSNGSHHSNGCNLSELPTSTEVKSSSIEKASQNDESPSGVFGLGQRFLLNGFRTKAKFVNDEISEPVTDQKSELQNTGRESLITSFISSPPLEHMKMSFHPLNGYETSKLKLKFSDGSHCSESSRNMFPSFQLVPEPTSFRQNIHSESDDDTFCKSSPYISDDYLSHHSDSSSEQWDSEETINSNDHELYIESRYSEGGVEISQSGDSDHILELPNFDTVNLLLNQEIKSDSNQKNLMETQCHKEIMPTPPPLPPVEWRALKSQSDLTEAKQDDLSKLVSPRKEQNTEALKPGSALLEPKNEGISIKPQIQQVNGHKETNQAANGKGIDEREDFLQQIRTKSFSLRRTTPARPNITSGPTASIQVNALLKKANAIRQAVGSDVGEEDDNWSDA